MIFLIEYDRPRRQILTFEEYDDTQRDVADRRRLELELRTGHDRNREIVSLQAADEDALRRTHRRYFETAREIIESSTSTLG